MKNIKIILSLFIFAFCILSCSKDEEAKAPVGPIKEYPANMIYVWSGTVTRTDNNNTIASQLIWDIKANGVLEVNNGNQPKIIGEWYLIGNIFTCSYKSISGALLTYQLIKNKELVMTGFRGLNGETSGAGHVIMLVI